MVGTVMSNLGLEHALRRRASSSSAPRSATATSWRRCASNRLDARRRDLRPHHRARQDHHRRRHHLRAAGARRHEADRQTAVGAARRACQVPADHGQRARGASAWTRASPSRSRRRGGGRGRTGATSGRVVLRASGTEPVIRVMVEGEEEGPRRRSSRSPETSSRVGGRGLSRHLPRLKSMRPESR